MIVHNQIKNYNSLCQKGASGSRGGAAGEKWSGTGESSSKRAQCIMQRTFASSSHNRESLKDFIRRSNLSRLYWYVQRRGEIFKPGGIELTRTSPGERL